MPARTRAAAAAGRKRKGRADQDTHPVSWATQAAVADFTGLSVDAIKRLRLRYCRRTRGAGPKFEIDVHDLFRGWLEHHDRLLPLESVDDALQRQREAKAALAEIELRKARRELVSRDEFYACLSKWGAAVRTAAEKLVNRHGPEAGQVLTDVLEQSLDEFERDYADE